MTKMETDQGALVAVNAYDLRVGFPTGTFCNRVEHDPVLAVAISNTRGVQ